MALIGHDTSSQQQLGIHHIGSLSAITGNKQARG